LQPLPSVLYPIFGWTDILDLLTLIPLSIYLLWYSFSGIISVKIIDFALFLFIFANSLLLAFSFHLLTCAVCVLTTQIDPLVWIYRDFSAMARFPTDIYQKSIQLVLTFFIPVIVIVTVPAKALLGLLSWPWVVFSFSICSVFLVGSFKFWQYALKKYSSASS